MDLGSCLNRNPLHDIPCDLALPPVVEPCGARIGVSGQALYVFDVNALLQQVRNRGDAEGMGRVEQGEPDIL